MGESCCSTCELFAGKEVEAVERKPMEGPPSTFKIRITERGGEPFDFVPSTSVVTIGRVKGNDITLPKGNVSKRTAAITFRGEQVFVEDLKSTCGTYVDGRKITSAVKLGERSRIYIGDFILEVVQH